MIVRWIVGVALLFGILLLMLPDRDEESLARIASASMLACTTSLRSQLEEQLAHSEAVSMAAYQNPCPDLIAQLEIAEQGIILIRRKKHPITMELTPQWTEEGARWRCQGEPQALITRLCRGD